MVLACVLECSSLAAMVYLTVLVVTTRIGVNKDQPDKDEPAPPKPAARPRPIDPALAQPPPAVRLATWGEIALQIGVLTVLVGGTATIAVILVRWL